MNTRRGFLKSLTMASIAMALPKPEKLVINPTGYAGVERMRITSSGNVLIGGVTDSSSKLFIHGKDHRQSLS